VKKLILLRWNHTWYKLHTRCLWNWLKMVMHELFTWWLKNWWHRFLLFILLFVWIAIFKVLNHGSSNDNDWLCRYSWYRWELRSLIWLMLPKLQLNQTLMECCFVSEDSEKLSLIKLASIIEVSAKKGTRDLKLQGKLIGCLIL